MDEKKNHNMSNLKKRLLKNSAKTMKKSKMNKNNEKRKNEKNNEKKQNEKNK